MPSITRRSAPQPDRRSAVETRVLDATQRLLADGASFTELGVQRIADEARVGRSTFYTHFRDKSDLLMRLADAVRTEGFDIGVAWEPSAGVDGLAAAFERGLGVYRQYSAVVGAVIEVAAYDHAVRELWTSSLNRFVDNSAQLIRDEQQAGRVAADVDPVLASRVIVVGGDRAMADHVMTNDDTSSDAAFARELASIWWYGAYQRRPSSNTAGSTPMPFSVDPEVAEAEAAVFGDVEASEEMA